MPPSNAFSPTSHSRREAINRLVPRGRSGPGPPRPLLTESGSQGQGHGRREQAQPAGPGDRGGGRVPREKRTPQREHPHKAGRPAARGTARARPAPVVLEGEDVKLSVCQPTYTPDRDRLAGRTRSPLVYFTAFSPPGARTGVRRGSRAGSFRRGASGAGVHLGPRGFSFQRARRSI